MNLNESSSQLLTCGSDRVIKVTIIYLYFVIYSNHHFFPKYHKQLWDISNIFNDPVQ